MNVKSNKELRAEIAELRKEAPQVIAHIISTHTLPPIKLPPEVAGYACKACGGDGRLEQGHGSGKWVRCVTCKGTGAA